MTSNRLTFPRQFLSRSTALAVVTVGMTGAAYADNLSWSLGLSSPGVVMGVSNVQPVYVQPRPVYVQPQVIYTQPQRVYVQPQPVYLAAPQVVYPGWRYRERHDRQGHHWGNQGHPYPPQYVQPAQYAPPVHYAPQVVVPAPVHGYGHNWR